MIKSRILRATALAATSLGLVAGLTGIAGASTGTINTTGPHSSNKIVSVNKLHVDSNNTNDVALSSQNMQSATSGNAKTTTNTTAGDARTGSATNNNTLNASLTLTNSMPDGSLSMMSTPTSNGSISNTGPFSDNKVVSVNSATLDMNNQNTVSLQTFNTQDATSGSARVSDNTTGGSAVSGDASNTSSSSFTINISN